MSEARAPAVALEGATCRAGDRPVWTDLSLAVRPGEFLAIMGPNGAGKTTLLRVLLGLQRLAVGRALVAGQPPRPGNPAIGYVPQHRGFDPDLPVRGRDLVAWGLDGHRWGVTLRPRATARRVDDLLEYVGARGFADAPVGELSGGEQQRLRIAQALIGNPTLLLCDEPLSSLDLRYQQMVVGLITDWNRRRGATVLFVTHDINPVLSVVDRILLLAGTRWAEGAPTEILRSETLTRVYGSPVDVLEHRGRVVILGADLGAHEPIRDYEPSEP